MTSGETRGSDILIVEDGIIAHNLKFGNKPEVVVPVALIRNNASHLIHTAQGLGIKVNEEQAIQAAIIDISAHEWAHSLEHAITKAYLKLIKGLDEYDDDKDHWTALGIAQDAVYSEISTISMASLPNLDLQDSKAIHIERFATGFQLAALEFGLTRTGLTADESTKIKDAIIQQQMQRLSDFSELRSRHDMGDRAWDALTLDLKYLLRNNGMENIFVPHFPKDMGYFDGYTRDQLTTGVSSAFKGLDEDNIEKQLMEGRRKYKL